VPDAHIGDILAGAALLVGASAAATLCARRAGLGSVLGLLLVGVVLGPHTPGPTVDFSPLFAATEIGVILLLFVVGLELEPGRLWAMRRMLFGLGTLQVLGTGVVLAAAAHFAGRPWQAAVVAGFGLALSSTAFVLQLLTERGEFGTAHGRTAFAVLLLQDMAVVPLLALVPLLAPGAGAAAAAASPFGAVLRMAGALAALSLLGTALLPGALLLAARQRDREAFALVAVAGLLLAAWVSHAAGLSPAMGAFFLGVLLSRSALHHQVAAEIVPFKGLLLGLFFISVGMSIDLGLLQGSWPVVLGQVAGLVLLKALALLGLCRLFGLPWPVALRTSVLLTQGGEFGFVLFGAAAAAGVIGGALHATLLLVISVPMALTPLLVRLGDRAAERLAAAGQGGDALSEPPLLERAPQAAVIGYGRVGQAVTDMLQRAGVAVVAVELDLPRLQVGGVRGHHVAYCDAGDPRVLARIGGEGVGVVVVAVDRPERAKAAVSAARTAWPRALILARAHDEGRRAGLDRQGASVVLTETFELSLGLAEAALERLAVPRETAGAVLAAARRPEGSAR
jgi:glutathione-regulated potassium-efflux system protein KefB